MEICKNSALNVFDGVCRNIYFGVLPDRARDKFCVGVWLRGHPMASVCGLEGTRWRREPQRTMSPIWPASNLGFGETPLDRADVARHDRANSRFMLKCVFLHGGINRLFT